MGFSNRMDKTEGFGQTGAAGSWMVEMAAKMF